MKYVVKSIIFFILFFFSTSYVWADAKTNEVRIYFFHSNECSHCKEEGKLLDKIEKKYDNVVITRYEVHDDKSINVLEHVKDVYHISGNGVPITVIGDKVFIGYRSNKSVVSFVRAIEYYSRYTYKDRVMGNVDVASDYQHYESIPLYKDFTKNYYQYSLFGISSDDLSVDVWAILMGVFSQINILSLVSVIVVLFFLKYIGGDRAKILLLSFYIFSVFLFKISEVIHYDYFSLGIGIFFFLVFMLGLIFYFRNKRRTYLMMDIFIFLVMLLQCFSLKISSKYVMMLKNICSLHLLDGVEKYLYYGNYFFSILVLDILFIMIVYLFFQKKLIR